jgi:hypothetical protein
MSQTIKNITIAHVPNDRAVIALMLEYLGLLKCKKMCIMPDFQRSQLCYTAYIEVAEWCDRESAYNLIKKIKDPRKEARVVYADDNWWTIEETTKANLCFTQGSEYERWTTVFQEKTRDLEPCSKQVLFDAEELEQSMTIEDVDQRLKSKNPRLDFNEFCIGFGLAYGFDFEAEYKEWSQAEEAKADKRMVDDIVLEMEF